MKFFAAKLKEDFLRLGWQTLLLNSAAILVATGLIASSYGLKRAFSLENLVSSFVYSNCTGTLIYAVIFLFAPLWVGNSLVVRLAKVMLSIFIATFAGITLAKLILAAIFPAFSGSGILPGWRNFVFSLCITFTFGFGAYFYEVFQAELAQTKEELRQKELAAEKNKTLATEAQLASLESRMHPHFLFNTLNSIAALIREEPALAEKMVEKLSALLRYSLDSNTYSLVPLEQELDITEKYLEIEKMRLDDRLSYKIETHKKYSNVKLPPFSLQTLVENAIKHVASKRSEKTEIIVRTKEKGANLEIEVSDNGAGFSADNLPGGHGLDVLQKRLKSTFRGNASLEIIAIGGSGGKVKMNIPFTNE